MMPIEETLCAVFQSMRKGPITTESFELHKPRDSFDKVHEAALVCWVLDSTI